MPGHVRREAEGCRRVRDLLRGWHLAALQRSQTGARVLVRADVLAVTADPVAGARGERRRRRRRRGGAAVVVALVRPAEAEPARLRLGVLSGGARRARVCSVSVHGGLVRLVGTYTERGEAREVVVADLTG